MYIFSIADRVGISVDKARDLLMKTGVVWDTDPNRKGILDFYDAMEKQGLIPVDGGWSVI